MGIFFSSNRGHRTNELEHSPFRRASSVLPQKRLKPKKFVSGHSTLPNRPSSKVRIPVPLDFMVSMKKIDFPDLKTCFELLPPLENYSKISNKEVFLLFREDYSNGKKGSVAQNYKNDRFHVFMPFSRMVSHMAGTQKSILGKGTGLQYWTLIERALNRKFRTCDEVIEAMKSYNKNVSKYNFDVLKSYSQSNPEVIKLMNEMIGLTLELPNFVPKSIPLLNRGKNAVLFLSQMQIACILANAFFCTFPLRTHQNEQYSTFPIFNLSNLFTSKPGQKDRALKLEKLKCLFNYFSRVLKDRPNGVVSFERQCLPLQSWNWRTSGRRLSMVQFSTGAIESKQKGYSEVDFANKYIGGGVITSGSVQEEIRFLLSPELIVARLFTESLGDTEALIITGAEQFNECDGYSDTFRFRGNFDDQTSRDRWDRRLTQIIAIDAQDFGTEKGSEQYDRKGIDRELNKAYSGFMITDTNLVNRPAIATGKWGCGSFRGDPHLKCLIQIIAASEAERDLVIFTYNDDKLADDLEQFYQIAKQKNVTLGSIYGHLIEYKSKCKGKNVLDYLTHNIVPYNTRL